MASQSTQLEDTSRIWGQVLTEVQNRLGSQQTFETWFKPIQPIRLGPQAVELEVPNTFFVDWIHEHHLPALREILKNVFGRVPEIHFSTRESPTSAPGADAPATPTPALPRRVRTSATPGC